MKVANRDSIKYKVEVWIRRTKSKVLVRSDLADLGAYRQISRALKCLVEEKKLAKIGQGVYAKMRTSAITSKPVLDGAFTEIARQTLDKLDVDWEPESMEKVYNTGRSTQVPVSGRVRLKSRFNRKISWQGMELRYEKKRKRA